jgi:hypothetical protein
MDARDGGCTFPGCPAPPGRCQAMHLTAWADGGPTTIDNGGLGCHFDHRERINQGWRTQLINERVAWIPPRWIDVDQRPQFNDLHQPGRAELDLPP